MKGKLDPIGLSVFANRMASICDEMGAVLRNAAFSPNIRDRLDFSCAIFDADGGLVAQAAHIPVHLGSMAYAMRDIVTRMTWGEGDQVILNDPYLGGTHLPDVTVIAPVFVAEHGHSTLTGFVANRAHHADIGAVSPGSMPVSKHLADEGLVIEPVHLVRGGHTQAPIMSWILGATRNSAESAGDFAAQVSANRAGAKRLAALIAQQGLVGFRAGLDGLNRYAARLARRALRRIPDGRYASEDLLDDDGQGHLDLPIRLCLGVRDGEIMADFSGTASQVPGNVNCPESVVAAAVYYVVRCLLPAHTPACAGTFAPIRIHCPPGCLLNARSPAAVAAGNVETSSRVVDVVLRALAAALPEAIPAASQGTMNNVAMGTDATAPMWDYYETIGGGMGAGPAGAGLSGVQTHMTNTRNTPVEVLESRFPLRIRRYAIRRGSGGAGSHRGGDGLLREFEFLSPARFTLLTERRRHPPWGLRGGSPARSGVNRLNGHGLPGKCERQVVAGDRLLVESPGGGGWGEGDVGRS